MPVFMIVIASSVLVPGNIVLSLLMFVAVILPSIASALIRHQIRAINKCRLVWIELFRLKGIIFRLAAEGKLEGRILEIVESKMDELRAIYLQATSLKSLTESSEAAMKEARTHDGTDSQNS
jgi:hypothetical protein